MDDFPPLVPPDDFEPPEVPPVVPPVVPLRSEPPPLDVVEPEPEENFSFAYEPATILPFEPLYVAVDDRRLMSEACAERNDTTVTLVYVVRRAAGT